MKYTGIIFTLLLACNFSFAQTEALEGGKQAVKLEKEIEAKKGENPRAPHAVTLAKPPLYIIEGIVVSSAVLDGLDPKMIQSINVLKGKNATALYGAKGKDGVIVVKLKKKYVNKFKKAHQKKK